MMSDLKDTIIQLGKIIDNTLQEKSGTRHAYLLLVVEDDSVSYSSNLSQDMALQLMADQVMNAKHGPMVMQ